MIINKPDCMTNEEALKYALYLSEKYRRKLETLIITLDGDDVELQYKFTEVPFERIRRITGYLVGTTEKWNDAKTAELNDRITHGGKYE